jgi:hypothetical protein
VLERAVDNWLDKASERSFQVPFCYMLSRQGYTIVHISSHNAMELGKDVLAVDKKGTPCAFQLKGGDVSLRKWRDEVAPQVRDLAYGTVTHPSIDPSKRHRPFLVTNGNIDETVQRAINDENETLKSLGLPQIETRVGGQLKAEAKTLQSDLWPSELVDAKDLLELYLHEGKDVFPKAKLASLLESTLPFRKTAQGRRQPKRACNRAISSAAVLTALILSSFTEEENHVAEIEAWTLYVAYALALAERWNLEPKYYEAEVEIALRAIKNALTDLAEEVMERQHLAEGLATVDEPFYRVRVTWVAALLCILSMWRRADGEKQTDIDRFTRQFATNNAQSWALWGEAAISQFLAIYWHTKLILASSRQADGLLGMLANSVCDSKKPGIDSGLPDISLEAADCLPYLADEELRQVLPDELKVQLAKEPLTVSYRGYSHTLEGLTHLLVQQNWKRQMKLLWPNVTRINLHRFEFDEPWHFYRWRNEGGTERVIMPRHTQFWDQLKLEANAPTEEYLPELIRRYPLFALLFICVYPHRTSAPVLRWLNVKLRETVYGTGA